MFVLQLFSCKIHCYLTYIFFNSKTSLLNSIRHCRDKSQDGQMNEMHEAKFEDGAGRCHASSECASLPALACGHQLESSPTPSFIHLVKVSLCRLDGCIHWLGWIELNLQPFPCLGSRVWDWKFQLCHHDVIFVATSVHPEGTEWPIKSCLMRTKEAPITLNF